VLNDYQVGDYVELDSRIRGVIRYVGARKGDREDVWIGVETEERGGGKTDGFFDGINYFQAARRSALLVLPDEIVRIIDPLRSSRLKRSARPLSTAIQQDWFRSSPRELTDSEYEISRNRRRGGSSEESPRNRRSNNSTDYHQLKKRSVRLLQQLYDDGKIALSNKKITESGARSFLAALRQVIRRAISSRDKAIDMILGRSIDRLETKLEDMSKADLDMLMGSDSRKRGRDAVGSRDDDISLRQFTKKLLKKDIIMNASNAEKVFKKLDRNSDGYISYHDFTKACSHNGDTLTKLDNLLISLRKRSDTDSRLDRWVEDGKKVRGLSDFRNGLKRLKIYLNGKEARTVFENIDDRDKGYIYWREFARLVPTNVPNNDITYRDLLSEKGGGRGGMEADSDYVHRDEFVTWLQSRYSLNRISSRGAERIFDAIDTKEKDKVAVSDLERLLPADEHFSSIDRVLDRIHRRMEDRSSSHSTLVPFREFSDFLYERDIRISKKEEEKIFDEMEVRSQGLMDLNALKDACPKNLDLADWVKDLAEGRRSSWDRLREHQREKNREDATGQNMNEKEVRDWVYSLSSLDRGSQDFISDAFWEAHVDGKTLLSMNNYELKNEFKLQSNEREAILDGISELKLKGKSSNESKDPFSWSCSKVVRWLEEKNFPREVIREFRRDRINGQQLEYLNEQDLEDLYIDSGSLRDEILNARDQLFYSVVQKKEVRHWTASDVKNWARDLDFDTYHFEAMNGKELLRANEKALKLRGVDRLDIQTVLDAIKKLRSEVDIDEFFSRLKRKREGFPDIDWHAAKKYFEAIDAKGKGHVNWDDFQESVLRKARSLRDLHKLVPKYARDVQKSANEEDSAGESTDPSSWDIGRTSDWLEERGYGDYINQFEVHKIDGLELKGMTERLLEVIDERMSRRTRRKLMTDIRELFE